jgi:hypothetical protein
VQTVIVKGFRHINQRELFGDPEPVVPVLGALQLRVIEADTLLAVAAIEKGGVAVVAADQGAIAIPRIRNTVEDAVPVVDEKEISVGQTSLRKGVKRSDQGFQEIGRSDIVRGGPSQIPPASI